jgi:hypothetical protein
MTRQIIIRFPNTTIPAANQHSETLRRAILDASPGTDVQRQKESQEAQDFGATLAIALAGPAVVAIAEGIKAWLERYRGVELEVTTPNGRMIAKNITASNVVDVISAARDVISKEP